MESGSSIGYSILTLDQQFDKCALGYIYIPIYIYIKGSYHTKIIKKCSTTPICVPLNLLCVLICILTLLHKKVISKNPARWAPDPVINGVITPLIGENNPSYSFIRPFIGAPQPHL